MIKIIVIIKLFNTNKNNPLQPTTLLEDASNKNIQQQLWHHMRFHNTDHNATTR